MHVVVHQTNQGLTATVIGTQPTDKVEDRRTATDTDVSIVTGHDGRQWAIAVADFIENPKHRTSLELSHE